MRELYAKIRQEQKQERLVVNLPKDEVDAFDRWAVENKFGSRAAALRQIIKSAVSGDAAQAA